MHRIDWREEIPCIKSLSDHTLCDITYSDLIVLHQQPCKDVTLHLIITFWSSHKWEHKPDLDWWLVFYVTETDNKQYSGVYSLSSCKVFQNSCRLRNHLVVVGRRWLHYTATRSCPADAGLPLVFITQVKRNIVLMHSSSLRRALIKFNMPASHDNSLYDVSLSLVWERATSHRPSDTPFLSNTEKNVALLLIRDQKNYTPYSKTWFKVIQVAKSESSDGIKNKCKVMISRGHMMENAIYY